MSFQDEYFDRKHHCRDRGDLRECADEKHAADQDLDEAEVFDSQRCEPRPAPVYQDLELRAVFDKVAVAEVDEDSPKHDAQKRMREK